MKKQSLYLILLVLISWTRLSSQSGVKDTTRCYGITQLKLIAKTAVDLNTCDTLLSTSKKIIANRDTMLKEKDYTITQYSLTVGLKNQQIKNREDSLAVKEKTIRKLNNHKKWLKAGWAATAIVEAALIIYFMIR